MHFVIVITATVLGIFLVPEICSAEPDSQDFLRQGAATDDDDLRRQSGAFGIITTSLLDLDRPPPPLTSRPGTPAPVVNACRASVEASARSFDPVHVDAVSAGEAVRGSDGVLRAPLEIQIIYSRGGEQEVRQSLVECHVDGDGRVVALQGLAESPVEPDREPDLEPNLEPELETDLEPDLEAELEPAPVRRAETETTGSLPSPSTDGAEVVEAFYHALGVGDGWAASEYVVPEKQREGPLSADAISGYFGGLARPLRTQRIARVGPEQYEVTYSYGIGSRHCEGTARVTLTSRVGVIYIASISANEDCS
jgi:hypothetical protein